MVNRRISSDLKECALRLWQSRWHRSDICWAFCMSVSSLYRWKGLFEEFGTVERPSSGLRGRPRTLGIAAMSAAKELYLLHPDTYLDELQWYLGIHHDISISISSLQENLDKAGLTLKVLHKVASERDEQLREDFRTTLRTEFTGTGDEFVAIDESSKNERDLARRRGRAMRGERAEIPAPFIRGERYSLVAAMTKKGYLAARVVPGSLDSFEFYDFILEEVVHHDLSPFPAFLFSYCLQAPHMNPFPDSHSVLVMDNCRIHHTEALRDVLNEMGMYYHSCGAPPVPIAIGIMLLYLPPYSPDLNPIEESFSTCMSHSCSVNIICILNPCLSRESLHSPPWGCNC